MGNVIPFRKPDSRLKGYNFDVHVWEKDGLIHYSVVQEFERVSGEEFEPLAYGTADSWDEAIDIVHREIKAVL